MSEREFEVYLDLLSRMLRLSGSQRNAVADELRDHMEQRLDELIDARVSRDEAVQAALATVVRMYNVRDILESIDVGHAAQAARSRANPAAGMIPEYMAGEVGRAEIEALRRAGRRVSGLEGSAQRGASAEAAHDLTETIQLTLEPDSWEMRGAPGSIMHLDGILIVNQSDGVHERMERFLAMYREALRSEQGTVIDGDPR